MSSTSHNQQAATSLPNDFPIEVFLDTSIFVARLKSNTLQERIRSTLTPFRFKGTSTYVLLEYGRVILKEVKYFVNKLRNGCTLEQLCYEVNNNLPDKFHSKKIKWLFNLMMQHCGQVEASERTLLHLEELLVTGTEALSAQVDSVTDDLNCIWAHQPDDWRTPTKCKSPTRSCRIVEFFNDNRPFFELIRDACRDASEDKTGQLKRFAEKINGALTDPQMLRDSKECRLLGDAIILTQSRNYRAFFTQNFNDSRTLCPVAAQILIELPQKLTDPVLYRDFRKSNL